MAHTRRGRPSLSAWLRERVRQRSGPGGAARGPQLAAARPARPVCGATERDRLHPAARGQPADLGLPDHAVRGAPALRPDRQRVLARRAVRRDRARSQPAALGPAAAARRPGGFRRRPRTPWPATATCGPATGMAVHLYAATAPMTDRYFVRRRRRAAVRAAAGRLVLRTELGALQLSRARSPWSRAGIRFRVDLPDGAARGYVCENYGAPFTPARARPDRLQRAGQPARLPGARAPPTRNAAGRSRWCRSSAAICGRRRTTIRRSTSSPGTAATCRYKYDTRQLHGASAR